MSIWSFYYQLQGAPKLWVSSIVFIVVGGILLVFAPSLVTQSGAQDWIGKVALQALGGTFLGLGTVVFLLMIAGLYVQPSAPQNKEVFLWWVDFIGGLLGAASFAVPATFVLPLLYWAYLQRPNVLYPDSSVNFSHDFFLGLLFSTLGIASSIAVYSLARSLLRRRPRWRT
jgi:hypothetical protein